jgi:hypothetical protein
MILVARRSVEKGTAWKAPHFTVLSTRAVSVAFAVRYIGNNGLCQWAAFYVVESTFQGRSRPHYPPHFSIS